MPTASHSTTLSRRQTFAGALAFTAMPTMALAAADPETELLNLWTRYRTLADAKATAEAHLEGLREVYTAKRPTIPDDIRTLGYTRWRADCDRLADNIGFTAAQADVDRLDAALWSIRAAIAKIPVTGYPGLRIKAMIVAQEFGVEGLQDPAVAESLVVDLGGRIDG